MGGGTRGTMPRFGLSPPKKDRSEYNAKKELEGLQRELPSDPGAVGMACPRERHSCLVEAGVFERMDTKKDKKIDADELFEYLKFLGHKCKRSDAEDMIWEVCSQHRAVTHCAGRRPAPLASMPPHHHPSRDSSPALLHPANKSMHPHSYLGGRGLRQSDRVGGVQDDILPYQH